MDFNSHADIIHFTLQGPSLLSPEAQFLVSAGCENSFPNSSGSSMASHRPPGFKPLTSRHGSASPAAPHAHTAFMSPHSGEQNQPVLLSEHYQNHFNRKVTDFQENRNLLCDHFHKSQQSIQDLQTTKGPWIPQTLQYILLRVIISIIMYIFVYYYILHVIIAASNGTFYDKEEFHSELN